MSLFIINTKLKTLGIYFILIMPLVFITNTYSQTTSSAKLQIEEIVVTAEKRVSSLQDTSISISVFSGDELNDFGITDSEQLSYYTPGLVIQRQVIGKVTMRGVGNENLTIGYSSLSLLIIISFRSSSHLKSKKIPVSFLSSKNGNFWGILSFIFFKLFSSMVSLQGLPSHSLATTFGV